MKYKIACWIAVEYGDDDDPILFDDLNEAVSEKEQLKFMHPDNLYRVVPVMDDDEDIPDTMDEVVRLNGG